MQSGYTVSQIMTKNVVVANLNNQFSQVMKFFVDHKIHHLPVVFDDKVLGILSYSDMLRFLDRMLKENEQISEEALNKTFRVEDVMTHNPVTISPDDEVEKVIDILAEGKFQSVIAAKDGLIYGIISNKDLIRLYQFEKEHHNA